MKHKSLASGANKIRIELAAKGEADRIANCAKEIDETHATINKNQEEYDKQLLTLSSGFLALSLAFIKDVVPTEHAIHRWLLYSSFVVLSVCVLGVLASFQVSNLGLSKAKEYWENQKDGDRLLPFPYSYARLIARWNIFTGLVFVIGIVLSVCFVITNLHQEAKLGNKTDSPQLMNVQEGAQMKTPKSGDWAQKGQNIKAPPPPPRPVVPPPSSPKK